MTRGRPPGTKNQVGHGAGGARTGTGPKSQKKTSKGQVLGKKKQVTEARNNPKKKQTSDKAKESGKRKEVSDEQDMPGTQQPTPGPSKLADSTTPEAQGGGSEAGPGIFAVEDTPEPIPARPLHPLFAKEAESAGDPSSIGCTGQRGKYTCSLGFIEFGLTAYS
ncbi:hypothetical protein B0H11DRAFT_1904785 [Mycena galericulata]|nr:hypothetical protein B0H11DRAFT_1904785 [Mycena galericulata]